MAPTVANPGNIVVPLSQIIQQLQGKLSAADLDALLLAVVAPRGTEVRPGDLITADLFNGLRADLAALQLEVANLQAGGGSAQRPVLISRDPLGDVEVGSRLTMVGFNFMATGSAPIVMLGGVAINSFLVADDSRLSFQVPDLFSNLPQDMTAFVMTSAGPSQVLSVRVLPKVSPQGGKAVILDQTPPLGQITEGKVLQFKWLVDSQTLQPSNYSWGLVFTNLTGASDTAWRAGSTVSPTGTQTITPGTPQLVTADVTVPQGAQLADVALRVQAAGGTFTTTSPAQHLEVGQVAVVSDPRTLVTIKTIPPLDTTTGQPNSIRAQNITMPDGSTLSGYQVKFSATAQVPSNVHVTSDPTAAGSYAYSAEVQDAQGLWGAATAVPATGAQVINSDKAVTVTLSNSDASMSATVKFLIVKAAHTPQGSASPDFTSFTRVPIQGATF